MDLFVPTCLDTKYPGPEGLADEVALALPIDPGQVNRTLALV